MLKETSPLCLELTLVLKVINWMWFYYDSVCFVNLWLFLLGFFLCGASEAATLALLELKYVNSAGAGSLFRFYLLSHMQQIKSMGFILLPFPFFFSPLLPARLFIEGLSWGAMLQTLLFWQIISGESELQIFVKPYEVAFWVKMEVVLLRWPFEMLLSGFSVRFGVSSQAFATSPGTRGLCLPKHSWIL